MKPGRFAEFAALAQRAGRQVCAVDFKWEFEHETGREPGLFQRCPGKWEQALAFKNASVWRLVPGEPATAK